MLIRPVYVIEPKQPVASRRALLIAAAAGVAGLLIGCGVGVTLGRDAEAAELPEANPRLAHACHLATQPDLTLLLGEAAFLLSVLHEEGQRGSIDPRLWQGCTRLSEAVLQTPADKSSRVLAVALAGVEHYPHPTEFAGFLPGLRTLAKLPRQPVPPRHDATKGTGNK